LLRGNGPLGPISRRLQGRRLTRHSQPGSTSRFRRFEPRIARHRLAAMPLTCQSSVIRVTRTAGGWTRVLASSALVRRSVMRALLPREPALRPTPSTEPARCLDARAPVGSTPFDVCHADPPRVVTAGRAFTTNDPPTSDVPLVACRHPQPAPSGESSSYAPLSRSRPTTPSVLPPPTLPKDGLRHLPEAPVPPPFDDVSEEHLLARPALAPPR
jgi:hypothetical protein